MSVRVRRTQEERSATTRARLLDATIDCLIDLGYAATTTTVIAERAGVSRGAQLHHYRMKGELVAAAVEHLAERLGAELHEAASRLPADGDRASAAVDLLWSRFSTPLFCAWLELWVAARTDEDLRAVLQPLEQRLNRGIEREARHIFGEGADMAAALTFYFMQGMSLVRTLGNESERSRRRREGPALEAWKRLVAGMLG